MGGNSDPLCQTIMHNLGLTDLGDLAIPPTPDPEPMDLSMSEEELEETMEEVYKKHMNTVQEETMEKMRLSSRIKPSEAVAKLPKIKISFLGVRARAE